MIKTSAAALLLSTALMTGAVVAQTPTTGTSAAGASGSAQFLTQQEQSQFRASKFIGLAIYGQDNQRIGDINEILIDNTGNAKALVLGVGGFLGIGEKNVAINFNQLQWTQAPDGTFRYVLNTTADALNAAPEFQYQDENATDEAAANQAAPGGNNTSGSGGAIVDANPNAANNAGAGNTTTMAPGAAAGGNAQAGNEGGGAPDRATLTPVDLGAMTAENLDGTQVYGTNNEEIGQIGDFVLNAQGQIDAVIVDVGGFLGIGEKPVALEYKSVQVQQNANGDIRILVNATQEQLQNAPAYAENAAGGAGQEGGQGQGQDQGQQQPTQ